LRASEERIDGIKDETALAADCFAARIKNEKRATGESDAKGPTNCQQALLVLAKRWVIVRSWWQDPGP
jgi:hypothetical protein